MESGYQQHKTGVRALLYTLPAPKNTPIFGTSKAHLATMLVSILTKFEIPKPVTLILNPILWLTKSNN